MKKIHIICLAAGNSKRFGSNKLLHSIQGKPMYQYTLELLSSMEKEGIGDICIVSQYPEILLESANRGFIFMENKFPDIGISHSIRLGIEALLERGMTTADAVMFLVCDQPYLKKATVLSLLELYKSKSPGIVCVKAGDRLGNPVIFSGTYISEFMDLQGDRGGKKVLMAHLDDVIYQEIQDGKELDDIDYRSLSFHYLQCGERRDFDTFATAIEDLIKEDIPKVISVVGGGGKTTLIYTLARELKAQGKRVIVTTTTHMGSPEIYYEWDGDKRELYEQITNAKDVITVGMRTGENKIKGIPVEDYPMLHEMADIIIVEADGAKCLPIKVPADHEPCIFPGSGLVIAVCGYPAVGKPISATAHRPELMAKLLETDLGHKLTLEDIITIFNSPFGGKKNVSGQYIKVINQCPRCMSGKELELLGKEEILLCDKED